jgi:ATP-dependent Clp protease, protease subunit
VKPLDPTAMYATLAGPVDAQMVQRVFGSMSIAVNNGIKTVHLLLQSQGGFVSDGICLYNYFRKLPMKVVAYNAGSVMSVAVIVFLAAEKRKASSSATFMIHKTQIASGAGTTANQLRILSNSLSIDDQRTEKILREHTHLPESQWEARERGDLNLTADEALGCGLVDAIEDFSTPEGAKLYNV